MNEKFKCHKIHKLYSIENENTIHFFGDLVRGYSLYYKGLSYRKSLLFNSYALENISFKKDDIVIDCGANYGDLWLELKTKIKNKNYITFEPGIKEYSSICKNNPNGLNFNIGLSNKTGSSKFYVNEKDADSSIIEPKNYSKVLEIKTITLSDFLNQEQIKKIKLFKIEAEGFEPEVLEGALNVLDRIQYIAIDGGYERGIDESETFTSVNNTLINHNFEMVSINFNWSRALYVRKEKPL